MTEALVLILGLVLFAVSALVFYEVYRLVTGRPTLSSDWTRLHAGRLVLLLPVGVVLTLLYVFLMGDLFFELW